MRSFLAMQMEEPTPELTPKCDKTQILQAYYDTWHLLPCDHLCPDQCSFNHTDPIMLVIWPNSSDMVWLQNVWDVWVNMQTFI